MLITTRTRSACRLLALLALFAFACLPAPGRADLVWQNTKTGDLAYWYTNGAAYYDYTFLAKGLPTAYQVVGMADLDGDGSQDILFRNNVTGDLAYWLMSGTANLGQGTLATNVPLEWKVVGLADLDGDGSTDIVFQNTQTGDVAYWLLNGTALASSGLIAKAVPLAWQITSVGDMNGDGSPDLIWQNSTTGDVAVWNMQGTAYAGGYTYASGIPAAWQVVSVASLNGDNLPTLLWQNTQTGESAYWFTALQLSVDRFFTYGSISAAVGSDWHLAGALADTAPQLTKDHPPIPFARLDINGALRQFPQDYKGKIVMLDFWATWCGPCKQQIPFIVAAYNKYHNQGFEILGVTLDDADQLVNLKQFLLDNKMPWPQIYDGGGWSAQIPTLYSIQFIPQPFLINGNTGKIIAGGSVSDGPDPALSDTNLDATIAAALKKL